MNVVRTYSGFDVSISAPDSRAIDIRDIACSLSRINRFGGATRLPLNVADHSLNVVRWLALQKAPMLVQMLGLLHDAHEAYIGDITAPMRLELARRAGGNLVQKIADQLDIEIRVAFGLPRHADVSHLGLVYTADLCVAAAEWRDLMPGRCPIVAPPAPFPIKPRNADQSELAFLKAFDLLQMEIGPSISTSSEARGQHAE